MLPPMARTHTPREAKDAVIAIFRAADRLRRHFTPLLESHGITLQQYNVLRILRGAGKEGLCTLELAGRMIEQAPGSTRLIDRLEANSSRPMRTGPASCYASYSRW